MKFKEKFLFMCLLLFTYFLVKIICKNYHVFNKQWVSILEMGRIPLIGSHFLGCLKSFKETLLNRFMLVPLASSSGISSNDANSRPKKATCLAKIRCGTAWKSGHGTPLKVRIGLEDDFPCQSGDF